MAYDIICYRKGTVRNIYSFIPFRKTLRKYLFTNLFNVYSHAGNKAASSLEIDLCCLVSHQHVTMFLHTINSFYQTFEQILPILIIDDGSLTVSDKQVLQKNLNLKILKTKDVLKKISPLLSKYPYLNRYFHDKNTSVKKFKLAFLLLSKKRKIITEPDIFFFKQSPEISSWINGKSSKTVHLILDQFATNELTSNHMVDLSFRKLIIKTFHLKSNYLFNGGLLLFKNILTGKELILLNKACQLFYEIDYIYNSFCEEILLELLTNEKKDIALDPDLYKTVWSYKHYKTVNDPFLIHYAGYSKDILERDALQHQFRRFFHIS